MEQSSAGIRPFLFWMWEIFQRTFLSRAVILCNDNHNNDNRGSASRKVRHTTRILVVDTSLILPTNDVSGRVDK